MRRRCLLSLWLCLFFASSILAQEPPSTPSSTEFTPLFSWTGEGKALLGTWHRNEGTLVQSDSGARWAMFAIPFVQRASDYIFRFRIKATSAEWTGGGIHIFASGKEKGSGYGYGPSYMVWLTRDVAYYKNGGTYLQLYRSFSNRVMIQVASIQISENLGEGVTVDVFYNMKMEILSLSIDGDLKLFFPVRKEEAAGTEIVCRALGAPVYFNHLEILAPTK